MEYPCPVFDEEAEMSDERFLQLLFVLAHEQHFTLEQLRAYGSTIFGRNGKAD